MQPLSPADPREDIAAPLLRRFFPLYCLLAAAVTWGYALYDRFQLDGDAVAYMDIGDNLRAHRWAGIVNGYWHPMYPAFLSFGHILLHATLRTELRAYYSVNFAIFLLEMLAIVLFADALLRLRATLQPASDSAAPNFLLTRYPLRYLAVALLVIASQRELSLGKVRPDALLQAFLLFALAALLAHLATNRLRYAALMGLALGCAYLTKSFAFLFALCCILALVAFRWIWLKHKTAQVVPAALIALATFALVAGPYVAALSRQHGRLDFGDSGSLNYAWFVAGTEKMHLQPYQTSQFGSADVHLKHPERELLHSPLILSYAEMPFGTYPDWFDPTYWNDQIKPHFSLRGELSRSARDCVLFARYVFNHPEALILLALFLTLGARPTLRWRPRSPANPFWIAPLLLGVAIWGIYAIVNTEERYVTVAYLTIILTLFATLRLPDSSSSFWQSQNLSSGPSLRPIASTLIFLLALLAVAEPLRTVLDDRRNLSVDGSLRGWYSPTQFQAAKGLRALGVQPGDTVACVGFVACLDDPYWARLAGVRILTEIYDPGTHAYLFLSNMPNRDQAIAIARATGAKVLVAEFGQARVSDADPFFRNWHQLDDTTFYALQLNP
jgi:4-amino-4-deoxy-L-arabinose transferase-like glycosyltransferase